MRRSKRRKRMKEHRRERTVSLRLGDVIVRVRKLTRAQERMLADQYLREEESRRALLAAPTDGTVN